jgi:hypothetical protein
MGLLPTSCDISYSSSLGNSPTTLTPQNFGNGFSWVAGAAPYVGSYTDDSDEDLTVVVFSPCKMYQFTGDGPSFSGTAGVEAPVSLSFDNSKCAYIFNDCHGNQYEFDCQGEFLQVTLANGTMVQMGNPDMHMSVTDPVTLDVTTTSTLYDMIPSGPNAGLMASATLRRQVNGAPWTEIQRILYAYYGPNDPSGSVGDLQTVT